MTDWIPCGDAEYPIAFTDEIEYEGSGAAECVLGDYGRWTKYGICEFDGFTPDEIKALTLDDARLFYKKHYWDVLGCAFMPDSLARCVMDEGVNCGVHRAIIDLQQLIYARDRDGSWGPRTWNDLKFYLTKYPVLQLDTQYLQNRIYEYEHWGVGDQAKFKRGWLNRVENLAHKLGVVVVE